MLVERHLHRADHNLLKKVMAKGEITKYPKQTPMKKSMVQTATAKRVTFFFQPHISRVL